MLKVTLLVLWIIALLDTIHTIVVVNDNKEIKFIDVVMDKFFFQPFEIVTIPLFYTLEDTCLNKFWNVVIVTTATTMWVILNSVIRFQQLVLLAIWLTVRGILIVKWAILKFIFMLFKPMLIIIFCKREEKDVEKSKNNC